MIISARRWPVSPRPLPWWRSDIADLLAEVDRLTAELDNTKEALYEAEMGDDL